MYVEMCYGCLNPLDMDSTTEVTQNQVTAVIDAFGCEKFLI